MMKNKKLISAILAAASIAGGVVGAQASEFELNFKIEGEAQARVAADNLLNKKIEDNKTAIDANAKDIATNKAIATKAYGMAQTEQVERKIADLQIREDMKKADKELNKKNRQQRCKSSRAAGRSRQQKQSTRCFHQSKRRSNQS